MFIHLKVLFEAESTIDYAELNLPNPIEVEWEPSIACVNTDNIELINTTSKAGETTIHLVSGQMLKVAEPYDQVIKKLTK